MRCRPGRRRARGRPALATLLLVAAAGAAVSAAMPAPQDGNAAAAEKGGAPATLEETRLVMEKWIQTQQTISKERKDWQQGKDILLGRLELVKQEVLSLEKRIQDADASAKEAQKKRDALVAEDDELKATGAKLLEAVTAMEAVIRDLWKVLPDPIQTRVLLLYQRMPEDAAKQRVTVAERFQNVLGILNEVNKANNEITVNYEVHNLSDGKPSEVKTLYVGLAQAYFVSANGEAGIGHPTHEGWQWETSKTIGNKVLLALEIQQGKQTPAFVPLPVKIR
jgi:soluble cytochrome b562